MNYLPSHDQFVRCHRRRIEIGYLPSEERTFSERLRAQFPDIRYADKPDVYRKKSSDNPVLDLADHPDLLSGSMLTMIFVPQDWKPDWRFEPAYPPLDPEWLIFNLPWPRIELFHPAISHYTPETGFPELAAERRARVGGVANLPRIEVSRAFEFTAYWRADFPETRRKAYSVLRAVERMTTRKVVEVSMAPTISWRQTEHSKIRCSPASLAWATAAPMRLAGYYFGSGHLPYDCDPTKLGFVEGL